jgi:hypothetical protein
LSFVRFLTAAFFFLRGLAFLPAAFLDVSFFAAVFLALVLLAVERGTEAAAGVLPLRPKKVVSNRCILSNASMTAGASFVAFALATTGRAPAGRTSTRQRLSDWPVFLLSTSLRWISTRVSLMVNLRKMRLTLLSTKRISLVSTAIVLSLLT